MVRVEFLDDPALVLERAGEFLARDGLLNTVVASVTTRAVAEDALGVERDPDVPRWWAVLTDEASEDHEVVGVAMRTALGPPYPLYVLQMPGEAAAAFAQALVDRGEEVTAANGVLPATRVVADHLARGAGRSVVESQRTRLFELGELRPPLASPSGALRLAEGADAELCLAWFVAFLADADEQAGRERGSSPEIGAHTLEEMQRRIADQRIWLWELPDGEVVHLTAANPPSFGVSRVGPVYTPPEHRGHGYASAAVAEVSGLIRSSGARVCLFTDQANPTSNKIYTALGYEPVADLVSLELVSA
ncbi:MAG: GNAT family N-acetyltransferase [Nocardioides sp.]|uniref:GNAT family N-acetyltransferase n=1 Tax=Nocardioides sp. TaxID=35761 RepID=UPI0039E2B8FC